MILAYIERIVHELLEDRRAADVIFFRRKIHKYVMRYLKIHIAFYAVCENYFIL